MNMNQWNHSQLQSLFESMRTQQFEHNDNGLGFEAKDFFQDDHHNQYQNRRNSTLHSEDVMPLPLHNQQLTSVSHVERQAFGDRYKTLIPQMDQNRGYQSDQHLDSSFAHRNNDSTNQQTMNSIFSLMDHHQQQRFQSNIDHLHFDAAASASTLQSLWNNIPHSTHHKDLGHSPSATTIIMQQQSEVKKPVKSLSPYNYFFRVQRDIILNGSEESFTREKQEELLKGHWFRDRSKKRRHRKTHGKIAFATLSRMVSERWKSASDETKSFYREIAAKDLERYRRELNQQENGTGVTARSA